MVFGIKISSVFFKNIQGSQKIYQKINKSFVKDGDIF